MVASLRPVEWRVDGTRHVRHLFDVRDKNRGHSSTPLCGLRGIAVVIRDSEEYCRFCVAHEGLP